jgi:hypothetical protein
VRQLDELSPGGQKELAQRIGLSPATLSKFKKIHEARSRFEPMLDLLPHEYTTLYELAKLPDEKFELVVEGARIRPDMTADAVKAHTRLSIIT